MRESVCRLMIDVISRPCLTLETGHRVSCLSPSRSAVSVRTYSQLLTVTKKEVHVHGLERHTSMQIIIDLESLPDQNIFRSGSVLVQIPVPSGKGHVYLCTCRR